MFVKVDRSGYTRDGEQFCHGYFLVLMHPDGKDPETPLEYRKSFLANLKAPIHGAVVYTKYSQLGHFMMGHASLAGCKLILSGAYGEDGLTCDVPWKAYQAGEPIGEELTQAWNKGGGWNSAGNESPLMKAFGLKLLAKRKDRQ